MEKLTTCTYSAREFIYAPSYPYKRLRKILTSEGHIFDQELAFYLLEVSCPINILLILKTISINKERSEHRWAYLYPNIGKNNRHNRLDLNKYINLGAIKKNQEFASYALLHVTCDLYYIFSPGPLSIPAPLLNGPPWGNKIYLI